MDHHGLRRLLLFAIAIFFALSIDGKAFSAAPSPIIGTLQRVSGTAAVVRQDQILPAKAGLEIQANDTLRTGTDGSIGVVFQEDASFPWLTVEDNIAFPLRMHKVPKDQVKVKIREAAEILQIVPLLGRKPRQVSGGEAQRVALARAIVREPDVFLMDEPLSNLDANLRLHMRLELRRIQRQLKITTIYVTHDQAEAMTMADKVAIIKDGRLQQIDEPHTIYRKPSNAFVAGFVGNPPMNLLNGEAKAGPEDGGMMFVTSDLSFALPQGIALALAGSGASRKVVLGMRPEDLSVTRAGSPETEVSFDGSLLAVEPLGSYSLVDVKVGDTILKVQEGPYYVGSAGAKVAVHAYKERLRLFDGADGKAIV
jgi:multiple sugar transport system ATP-binding protein